MKTILLTGVTGFIGSNLLEALLKQGYFVLGIKRSTSNLWRIKEFLGNKNLKLIDIDNHSFDSVFKENKVDIVIHSAWGGVKAEDRNDLTIQIKNYEFSFKLFSIAIKNNVDKIVSLGSQAEYGRYEGRIDENYPCKPVDAYGTAKVDTSKALKALAKDTNTKWFWIRLFSLFGPKEDKNWLLPFAINKMLKNEDIDLTKCEQQYDYLFIEDFCNGILQILDSDKSGVYNFSSNMSVQLKEILLMIKDITKSKSKLNFGALQYRDNQVMHMEGDSSMFYATLKYMPVHNLRNSLVKTVSYYKNKPYNK
ncbi:NAD-dependent epimerase/dehydratase family protein [Stygiobacter electus]|uniref:NAD(P)-dependent oxidoreductase n=1 Tax=Stygiobacter electus TaxID=3032292 RepID=A0AAE3P2W1_9BACT|nr:NAD(P)-dependent oxidoreductase [Stygiobacter electus]MDF1613089.1 NAD(P)-dependent oxidoreductase [Stygiobacter electus]